MKTIILESGRCSHAKCIYCGYSKNERPVNVRLLKARLDQMLAGTEDSSLKVFSSGSFLDEAQFPKEFVDYFAEKLRRMGITKLTIESRPEYVTDESLEPFGGIGLTVAIGLESAHPEELKTIVKGFTVADFVRAAETLHRHGAKVRSYLLVNIPFVKDIRKSIRESVEFAKKYSDSIVVLNLLPHHKTPLMRLWMQKRWRPLSRKEFRDVVKGIDGVELDEETFRFIPQFPNKKAFDGVGIGYITNPTYDAWQDYIVRWYEKPEGKDTALFLPCSAKKPYRESRTHATIWHAIKGIRGVHRIVISSPGVIPFEFNGRYPFDTYDWDESKETPEIMKEYVRINKERIMDYLKGHRYKHHVAYFRSGSESYEALKQACDELGIELVNALPEGERVTSKEGLGNLRNVLEKLS